MTGLDASADVLELRVRAHAKWNPILRVGARRDDGFHELVSVLQTIELADAIEIRIHDAWETSVTVDVPGLAGGDTLVTRAVHALLEAMETSLSVTVQIDKQIPVAGGLAGGSADAVAVVRGVCDALDVDPEPDAMAEVLAGVGSDLPALWSPTGAALVGGRGERITPADGLPKRTLVLLDPGVPCRTAEIFARHVPTGDALPDVDALLAMAREGVLGNDLEPAARAFAPPIAAALDHLRDAGHEALLCGSGSTIAVVVESSCDADTARGIADEAACALVGGRPFATRPE